MTLLLSLDVTPLGSEVALVDNTWPGYPEWEPDEKWVAFRDLTLVDPEHPPYPGIAVATQGHTGPDGPRTVHVEVWSAEEPPGLRCVHQTVLSVGSHGLLVGNDESGQTGKVTLPRGNYPLKVLVNADTPDEVSSVVFALGQRV